jgi:hypothetical protein
MPMDSKHIESLLQKYWSCETSLEEERELKACFRDGAIPDDLQETAAFFKYLDLNEKKELTTTFDHSVLEKIEGPKKSKMRHLVFNSMRIAAGVGVLVVAFFLVRQEVRETTPQAIVDTYDDPKLAFEETKKALKLISKGFGTAETEAKKLNLFNKAKEQIQNEEPKSNL